MKVDVIVEVPDEEYIMVGDIISIKITLTRENLGLKDETRYIHSNKYPH